MFYALSSTLSAIILKIKNYKLSFWIDRSASVAGSPSPIKLGLPIKILLFKKYFNKSILSITSAIVYESLIRIIVLFVLAIFFGASHYLVVRYDIILIFIFIILIIMTFISRYNNGKIISKIKNKILDVKIDLINLFKSYKTNLIITFLQLILQLMSIGRIILLLNSIGVDSLTFVQVSRAVITSNILTTISMLPGGYVVKEISLIYLLQLEGIDYSQGVLIALADRSFQLMIAMIFGAFSSVFITKYERRNSSNIVY